MKRTLHTLAPVLLVLIIAAVYAATVQAMEPGVESNTRLLGADKVDVRFQVKVLGRMRIAGQFERFQGTLVSSTDGRSRKVRMRIETGSVNTRDEWRDDYLRGPTFFAAERYPHITFSGTCRQTNDNGPDQLVGLLSLHGTTKQVVFDVRPVAANREDEGTLYQAKARIKRSDFGLDSLQHIISDEVEIVVAMQAN